MSKITSGIVLFSLLMALSLGVAFAESEVAENETVEENATVNVTIANNTTNETAPVIIDLNNTTNESA